MYTYEVWVKINPYQTIHTRIQADTDYDARLLAESLYGKGNVLNYTRVYDFG